MKKLIILLTALLFTAGAADAKWWIFGKSRDEVGLKYLYIGGVSSDEAGPKLKVFRESLGDGGTLKISGKASTGRNAVGSVRITLDDKATWQDVKFSDNGAFEYAFKPEAGRTYAMLLEVTDTAGKTNKVDETRKELSISEENIRAKAQQALDALFAAYAAENLPKFMGLVGEDFAGDKAILERAVKRDFDALSSINIRYTLNSIASGAQGRVFVSITYSRMVFVNKTGATSTDAGSTEFVFGSREGKLSLYSMKQPLMFGLSDAENVASGTVLGGGEGLIINDSGDVGGIVVTRSYTSPDDQFGYNIETEQFEDCDGTAANCTGQVFFMPAVPYIGADDNPQTNARIGEVPGKTITTVTLADVQAAATMQQVATALQGKTFGLKYGSAWYAVEVTVLSGSSPGPWSVTLKTKAF
jgi:hypothetical protein